MLRDSTLLSPAAEGPEGSTVWMETPGGHLGLVSCPLCARYWLGTGRRCTEKDEMQPCPQEGPGPCDQWRSFVEY